MSEIAAKYDMTDDSQKLAYAREISRMIASLNDPVEREIYCNRAAEACGISARAISDEVKRTRSTHTR